MLYGDYAFKGLRSNQREKILDQLRAEYRINNSSIEGNELKS